MINAVIFQNLTPDELRRSRILDAHLDFVKVELVSGAGAYYIASHYTHFPEQNEPADRPAIVLRGSILYEADFGNVESIVARAAEGAADGRRTDENSVTFSRIDLPGRLTQERIARLVEIYAKQFRYVRMLETQFVDVSVSDCAAVGLPLEKIVRRRDFQR